MKSIILSECCDVEPIWQPCFKIYSCPKCLNACKTYINNDNEEVKNIKNTLPKQEYYDKEKLPIKVKYKLLEERVRNIEAFLNI